MELGLQGHSALLSLLSLEGLLSLDHGLNLVEARLHLLEGSQLLLLGPLVPQLNLSEDFLSFGDVFLLLSFKDQLGLSQISRIFLGEVCLLVDELGSKLLSFL